MQERWQMAASESERLGWAREFEKIVAGRGVEAAIVEPPPSFAGVRLEEFFADYLVHVKGAAAGSPFVLEPWQREFLAEFERTSSSSRSVPSGRVTSPLTPVRHSTRSRRRRSTCISTSCTGSSRRRSRRSSSTRTRSRGRNGRR